MTSIEQVVAHNAALRNLLESGVGSQLKAISGVVHVSVGLKEVHGRVTDELCIRVYVVKKLPATSLAGEQFIPANIDSVATDVIELDKYEFQNDNTRYRPIKGGIQITNRIVGLEDGRLAISRGTLGCIAIDKTNKSPVLLSNWHVLCAHTERNGENIFQPSPTSVPPATLLQLPVRPTDDLDKIAVIRRSSITNKVDAAIAVIDVSSCCHCCGIHYSNEINGLSQGGQPPRNTIVGDQRAVSGMQVFKVGQATLRTVGKIVDDDFPEFSITRDGKNYSFTGQIAVVNVDQSQPFSTKGDSGAVLINAENKIVGLIFAGRSSVTENGVAKPPLTLANHISDVLSALNIRIPYSPDVVTIAGVRLAEVPSAGDRDEETTIPPAYRKLRERLLSRPETARLFAIGDNHRQEVMQLINGCRPVTVAWHRVAGPAWLAKIMAGIRDESYQLPARIDEIPLAAALEKLRIVLARHGSQALQKTLAGPECDRLIQACRSHRDLREVIEALAYPQPVAGE